MSVNIKRLSFRFIVSPLALSVLVAVHHSEAKDYFDPSLLNVGIAGMSMQATDLSVFEQQGGAEPGQYPVDVYLNNSYVQSEKIDFVLDKKTGHLIPQLTRAQLDEMGVNTAALPELSHLASNKAVGDLAQLIKQASARFNVSSLRLDISVPQIAMKTRPTGLADPSKWDEGISALLLNYSLSGGNSWNTNGNNRTRQDNLFANVWGGINLGAWRLRSGFSYSYNHSGGNYGYTQRQWSHNDVYLQRDIKSLGSELTLGDISTGGSVLDSVPMRGVKLETNDNMTPDNLRGFAPIISGIAKSNAQITVRQNGNVLYQTYVAPGAFKITDLPGGSNQGDLQITVKEADGSEHSFTQSYTTIALMQRAGHLEYEVDAGKYRNNGNTDGSRTPLFVQGSAIYGLPHDMTVYGGMLLSQHYQSTVLGAGVSLGEFGAVSADMTLAVAQLQGKESHDVGQSYRVKYSKSMLSTGTTMDIAAYRFSTRNYYSFADSNSMGYQLNNTIQPWALDRRRNSWQVSLSQTLFERTSLYVSANRDTYWNNNRVNNTVNIGFNTGIKQLGIGVNYSIDHINSNDGWPENRNVNVNFSLPLNFFGSYATLAPNLNYSISHNNQGQTSNSVGLSGSFTDKMGYSITQNWGNQGQGSGGGLGLNYSSDIGNSNIAYNYSRGYRGINYGFNGGLLATPYGAALSPSLGDSAVLIRTPHAAGVRVLNGNTSTNHWGYAVAPMNGMYRQNTVNLDPTSLPDGVDIKQNSINVYPTQGAVVLADYKTRVGQQLLMNLTHQGKPIPFGAMASVVGESDQDAAIVGDAGQVYLTGLPEQGQLQVKWGQEANQQCSVRFKVGKPQASDSMRQVNEVCQ